MKWGNQGTGVSTSASDVMFSSHRGRCTGLEPLEELLGINNQDHEQRLASNLIDETQDMLDDLLAHRRARGLRQKDVAEKIGVSRTAITHFERYDADPRLSTIIRYAMAIGARIEIKVEDGLAWAKDEIQREVVGRSTYLKQFDMEATVDAALRKYQVAAR